MANEVTGRALRLLNAGAWGYTCQTWTQVCAQVPKYTVTHRTAASR